MICINRLRSLGIHKQQIATDESSPLHYPTNQEFDRVKTSDQQKVEKIGFILATGPSDSKFTHALRLAELALDQPVEVYVYLIRDGVAGADHPSWQNLVDRGLKLFACAYSARQRNIPLQDPATWVGLTVLNDLLVECDKTVFL